MMIRRRRIYLLSRKIRKKYFHITCEKRINIATMQETDILLDVSLPVIITYYSQLQTKQFLKYSNANNKA